MILAAGLWLRLWGLSYGLPHPMARPDEEVLVAKLLGFDAGDPNPHWFMYPTFYLYLLYGWVKALVLAAHALGLAPATALADLARRHGLRAHPRRQVQPRALPAARDRSPAGWPGGRVAPAPRGRRRGGRRAGRHLALHRARLPHLPRLDGLHAPVAQLRGVGCRHRLPLPRRAVVPACSWAAALPPHA